MNDQTNTTSEADDTEGHGYRAGIQIAKGANDTEDDTEGNCFKYRDTQPPSRPDDTEGHSAKSGHLQPDRDESDGRGSKNSG